MVIKEAFMTIPSPEDIAKMTPMMKQYFELKSDCQDAVLFFRMGDFYEVFSDDAEEVAPQLDIVLTARERGDNKKIPFCGVPHHSATGYWHKLLKKGYKVAVADQLEDAAQAKGLVKRGIVKVMTPGANTELEGLEQSKPNYLVATHQNPTTNIWSLTLVDISTGEFRLGEVSGWDEIVRIVRTFRPREILARRFLRETLKEKLSSYLNEQDLLIDTLPESALQDEKIQKDYLKEVFGKTSLKAQPCGKVSGGEALVASVIERFKYLKASLSSFLDIKPIYESETINLSDTVIRDLELFETTRLRSSKGSLFYQVNKTQTPMGARLLRWSLAHPFTSKSKLKKRHDFVSSLHRLGEEQLLELRGLLKSFPDVERLASRIASQQASPAELDRCRRGLKSALQLSTILSEKLSKDSKDSFFLPLKECIERVLPIVNMLDETLLEEPSGLADGFSVLRSGYDQTFDELVKKARSGSEEITAYEKMLRQQTGINSLKIKNHKTFGLLIEVTKSNLSRVPESFVRRQTMVNNERFITNDLKELEETLFSAQDLAIAKEAELFERLKGEVAVYHADLKMMAFALAEIDLCLGFSWLAIKDRYQRAEINDHQRIVLKASRHPVVEAFVGRHEFIANHIEVDRSRKLMLITGPNMAGKSTVMRQTALCAILNQSGSFVPAEKASLPLFDQIYTRVGASDDLSQGQSTFMVEMTEASQILRQATAKSLVILDEVGRGTSSDDGLSIAASILRHLSGTLNPWTLFATHYHELVSFSQTLNNVCHFQTEVKRASGRISFTHRLIEGASGSSFGIEVARLAGVPDAVLRDAEQILNQLEAKKDDVSPSEDTTIKVTTPKRPDRSPEVIARLERVPINRITPLQAINILSDLKDLLEKQPDLGLFDDLS